MSHYVTSHGSLVFNSKESLEKAIQPLLNGNWLKKDADEYLWLDEAGKPLMLESAVCSAKKSLTIPYASYRNLNFVIEDVISLAECGEFKCYSTDGGYYMRSWVNGHYVTVDDPKAIVNFAGTSDEADFDVLTMGSDEWESKYEEGDFFETLGDVMEAAFDRL